jgi:hypothetical protein
MKVTSFSYPPFCQHKKKQTSVKVTKSGKFICGGKEMVFYDLKGKRIPRKDVKMLFHKLKKVM